MTFPYSPLGGSGVWSSYQREEDREREDEILAHTNKKSRSLKGTMDAARAKDFIILSEFSEQVGPVPVVRIIIPLSN